MFNNINKNEFIFNELNRINTDLSLLKNSNIFITGGTGFIGKSILDFLIYLREFYNFNIIILTRNVSNFLNEFPQYKSNFIYFLESDIRTFKSNNYNFDYIIHMASLVNRVIAKEKPQEVHSIIVDGLNNLLFNIKQMNVKKLLFVSSGAVYGKKLNESSKGIKETDECFPISQYGIAKKESEDILLKSNINISIARCFAMAGEYMDLTKAYAMGNFIKNINNHEDIIITGNGKALRTYLYISDIVIWLLAILLKSKSHSIYNVGSSYKISIFDLANFILQISNNKDLEVKILNNNDNGVSDIYIPDNTKIINELGVKENFTLNEIIDRMLEQNRTEQNRTEQNRTEQNRTEQNRTE